jgi:hypothetical protein
MHQFDNPALMTEEGVFLSQKWQDFAELITTIDPYLTLNYIPYKNRTATDSKPYAICHCPPDRKPYVILFAGELDDPIKIYARLLNGNRKDVNVLKQIEAQEIAEKLFKNKQDMDALADKSDQFHYYITNRSPWYVRHRRPNGKIIKMDTTNGREIT